MRIAVVSDIHGNLHALEAVLADLRETAPDLILHGGDLADVCAHPAEVIDQIRDLGWPGVLGNTDEMLANPLSLEHFAAGSPHMQPLLGAIRQMAEATRERLGEQRLEWLGHQPRRYLNETVALVHASPDSAWCAPWAGSSDADLTEVFRPLDRPVAVYGHIHVPFIRNLGEFVVANTGSVGLSYDGDRRASYLLLDDGKPSIRRVEYDVDLAIRELFSSGLPQAEWVAHMLSSAMPQLPQASKPLQSAGV